MIRYRFDNRPQRVHIHQGGTLQAYCGLSLQEGDNFVAWEDSLKATCRRCAAHFPPEVLNEISWHGSAQPLVPEPCCPGAARGRCKVGCYQN